MQLGSLLVICSCWLSGTFPSGVLIFKTSTPPSKLDFEFQEAGTTIVLISGHLAALNVELVNGYAFIK